MRCLLLRIFSILECAVSLTAVRYGDYSVVRMPQYGGQHEESDLAPGPGADDYSDRSPDAPARLDYKYEEEPHGKSDDVSVSDIDDERLWNKKKMKPIISQKKHNIDLDKDSFDDPVPEIQLNNRVNKHRPQFLNRKFKGHLKHNSIDQSDDFVNIDIKQDHVEEEHVDSNDLEDFEEIRLPSHSSSTKRKARRKPRDRALHQPEREKVQKRLQLEDENEYFENNRAIRPGLIIDRPNMSKTNKKNYDYDEYYDMKRVQNMKNRLPALFRKTTETTVKTSEAQSARSLVPRQYRRASPSLGVSGKGSEVNSPLESTALAFSQTSTSSTEIIKVTENSTELSLAEKSRLSILKKAQRKENSRNISSTTKPPVLMQVTHKMQTVVVVEPKPAGVALRAREVSEDSPARLKRARRLMRHKLVAGARSIHDLTDNWDEMVCDYIDVALLDADAVFRVGLDNFIPIFIFGLWSLFINF